MVYELCEKSDYFRLRVGDYRVIFSVKEVITILKIGHRKNIYRDIL
ncbi:MAG: hypothetical protein MAG795_00509 [Candidatus Woesearchaeota archaeon]|nr:hypothetical protein [Candidatus Woesearchaeota archaeon]